MQNTDFSKDSAGWLFFVKASFVVAIISMGAGIYFLPCDLWVKGYVAMGLLFTIGSSITLSKTIRDEHESSKLINKINDIKTEKLFKEYDTD